MGEYLDSSEQNCSDQDLLYDECLSRIVLFGDYPQALTKFASLCCILFMAVGIPGNLITIIALARCKKTQPSRSDEQRGRGKNIRDFEVFSKKRKVRNATAVFIMNLSCSDLLFCCFNLPLAASTFWRRAWTHGGILCRMFPLARYALVAVSVFTVLAITINRYVMISHPHLYPRLYKRRYLAVMVITLWAASFGALIPTWLGKWGKFGLDVEIGSCSILPDDTSLRSPKEFLFVVAFALPCLAIIICYARIFFIARETARRSRSLPVKRCDDSALGSAASDHIPANYNNVSASKNHLAPPLVIPTHERSSSGVETLDENDDDSAFETAKRLKIAAAVLRGSLDPVKTRLTAKDKRLLKMIFAIAISFFVCYLPITLTKICKELTSIPIANIAGYLLIYTTTCINPIIYVVMSSEYRQAYKNLLMCKFRKKG